MAVELLSSLPFEVTVLRLQLCGLVVLGFVLSFVEKNKAMRGCNRAPLSPFYERLIRFSFLCICLGPTVFALDNSGFSGTDLPVFTTLLALYMVTYCDLSEQNGGRRTFARSWTFPTGLFKQRVGATLVKTVDLDQDKAYIFGLHPHGVLPFGGMVAMNYNGCGFPKLFPGVDFRTLAATFCFYVPLYRELLLWAGGDFFPTPRIFFFPFSSFVRVREHEI